jgi:histone H3/H4
METELPIAAIQRIAKKGGAERIGKEAAEVIGLKAEAYIKDLAKKAATLADHAGRKTIKVEDIEMAGNYAPVDTKEPENPPKKVPPADKIG